MTDDLCLDVSAHGGPVKLYKCHGMKGNQLWEYDKHSLAIRHVNSNQVSVSLTLKMIIYDYFCHLPLNTVMHGIRRALLDRG